jgi:type IX secretion system substrate protein
MKQILVNSNSLLYLLLVSILMGHPVKAQIVYTDIKDVTFTCNKKCDNCYSYDCNKSYSLDLNNDGTTDFNINTGREVRNWDGGNGTYCCTYEFSNWVSIRTVNDNSVLVTLGSAAAVMARSDISSISAWSAAVLGNFNLRSVSRNCQLDYSGLCGTIRSEGNWPSSTDRYLGLKIILNGQTYYGWARLSVIVDESKASFKIKDYAYERTPGQTIHAGDTGGASVAKPSISKEPEANATQIRLNIAPNPVSSNTTVSFTLLHQEKVSLNLYDITGRLVNKITEREFKEGPHLINLDTKNLIAGIYLLRLQSQSFIQTKKLVVLK